VSSKKKSLVELLSTVRNRPYPIGKTGFRSTSFFISDLKATASGSCEAKSFLKGLKIYNEGNLLTLTRHDASYMVHNFSKLINFQIKDPERFGAKKAKNASNMVYLGALRISYEKKKHSVRPGRSALLCAVAPEYDLNC
jgi:hypothetical protein